MDPKEGWSVFLLGNTVKQLSTQQLTDRCELGNRIALQERRIDFLELVFNEQRERITELENQIEDLLNLYRAVKE